jgi:hypothetical protein
MRQPRLLSRCCQCTTVSCIRVGTGHTRVVCALPGLQTTASQMFAFDTLSLSAVLAFTVAALFALLFSNCMDFEDAAVSRPDSTDPHYGRSCGDSPSDGWDVEIELARSICFSTILYVVPGNPRAYTHPRPQSHSFLARASRSSNNGVCRFELWVPHAPPYRVSLLVHAHFSCTAPSPGAPELAP